MAEPRLRKVAWARNQAEAELIQGLLREHGVPSVERRERGFDVPDFLAAGPRAILVAEQAFERAREVLDVEPLDSEDDALDAEVRAGERTPLLRMVAALITVVLLIGFLVSALYALTG